MDTSIGHAGLPQHMPADQIPGGLRRPGRRRRNEGTKIDFSSQAPYLRGVPQLSDYLCSLAARRRLTVAEESCLTLQVRKLCKLIRKARAKWEAEQVDGVHCPPEPRGRQTA